METQNKKKICIAIHGLSHAGAERVASSWANFLVKNGYSVSVVVYAPTEEAYDLDARVRVVPLADSREEFLRWSMGKQLAWTRNVIRREKPDVLISFLPKMQVRMMLATWGMKIRRVETVRNNPWIDQDVAGIRMLWNLCFRRSHRILVQTGEQAGYFPKRLQKKCVVISNPISRDFLTRQKCYTDDPVRRFVAVARINEQKNYPMMVRAFARAVRNRPDCTLDIYGSGSMEQIMELQGLIRQLGMENQIRLQGWKRDVSGLLPEYDAFLMSSDYEGMPNALAEAMATGLMCLSTDCKTGPKDMIDHGVNGFLAKTGDAGSFAEGIEKILKTDRQQRSAMGAAAREKILNLCSEDNTLARMKRIMDTLA